MHPGTNPGWLSPQPSQRWNQSLTVMHAHADELKDPAAKSTCRLDLALCRTLSSDRTTEGVDVLELNVMNAATLQN